jgi:DNA-binding XRE family transcriptional regulator
MTSNATPLDGTDLAAVRKDLGLTQMRFCRLIGVSQQRLSALEVGKKSLTIQHRAHVAALMTLARYTGGMARLAKVMGVDMPPKGPWATGGPDARRKIGAAEYGPDNTTEVAHHPGLPMRAVVPGDSGDST